MKIALVTLAVVVAGGVFAAWFFMTHERVVVDVPAAYQGEARFNRFLAAEMLLRKLDFDADSRASLTPSEWLPTTRDTLFVRSSATLAGGEELERLGSWVLNGGHLVLLAPEPRTLATDAVFEHFGFRPIETEPPEGGIEEHFLAPGWAAEPGGATYALGPVASLQRFEVAGDFASPVLSDGQGIFAARRPWGTGYVTVLAGSMLFENAFLANSDHARLLVDTVAGYVDPGKVWLVYDVEFPPLWQLIWTYAPYAVVGLALTLVLGLWSAMPRFGPAITAAAPVRRSIIEHVEAAGRFVWRHDGAETLVASSIAAVLRRAEATHPGITRLPEREQAASIAEMTGQAAPAVLAALASRRALDPREFTRKIHTLQTMRKKL